MIFQFVRLIICCALWMQNNSRRDLDPVSYLSNMDKIGKIAFLQYIMFNEVELFSLIL